jgi:hypothetical protein
MASGFQVLKFIMAEFDANWERTEMVTGYSNVEYKSKGGGLAILVEGATGILRTYRYKIPSGEKVFVLDRMIHIPEHCTKEEPGNTIRCTG